MTNTIAIVGHSGTAGKPITAALVNSDAKVKVLYRAGSDLSSLDPSVETILFDYEDEASITKALQGVDILVFLTGGSAIPLQAKFIAPFKAAKCSLFVPSELGWVWKPEEAARTSIIREKAEFEDLLKEQGVPMLRLSTGGWTEEYGFELLYGVNNTANTISVWGNGGGTALSSMAYVVAGFKSMLVTTPPSQLANRSIGLVELAPTAKEVIAALERRNGSPPKVTYVPAEDIIAEQDAVLANVDSTPELQYAQLVSAVKRKVAENVLGVGEDIWEVAGWKRMTVDELVA